MVPLVPKILRSFSSLICQIYMVIYRWGDKNLLLTCLGNCFTIIRDILCNNYGSLLVDSKEMHFVYALHVLQCLPTC